MRFQNALKELASLRAQYVDVLPHVGLSQRPINNLAPQDFMWGRKGGGFCGLAPPADIASLCAMLNSTKSSRVSFCPGG